MKCQAPTYLRALVGASVLVAALALLVGGCTAFQEHPPGYVPPEDCLERAVEEPGACFACSSSAETSEWRWQYRGVLQARGDTLEYEPCPFPGDSS